MLAELVLAHRQHRVAGGGVVEAFINLGLQMLGPEAHRERLAFQRHALPVQHGKGVPGAVADRQDQLLAGKIARCGLNARQGTVFDLQTGQGGVEPHLTAQRDNFLPDAADDAAQKVSTHMGLLPPGNVRRGAVLQKGIGHKGAKRVAHAGGQLAVGESTCAALAKLDVGVQVQFTGLFKMLDGFHALVQFWAAFQHQRTEAAAGQQQRGKEARRAKAHDHRARF